GCAPLLTLACASAHPAATSAAPQVVVSSATKPLNPPAAIQPSQQAQFLEDDPAIPEDASEQRQPKVDVAVDEATHPLEGLTEADIRDRLVNSPQSLGSMSVGNPNGGVLFNAVQLPEDPRWERVDPAHAWGTRETVDYIEAA